MPNHGDEKGETLLLTAGRRPGHQVSSPEGQLPGARPHDRKLHAPGSAVPVEIASSLSFLLTQNCRKASGISFANQMGMVGFF